MRVAIIGRTKAMMDTANLLISLGYDIPLVITCKEAPEYQVVSQDFENFANSIGALFFNTAKINNNEIINKINNLEKIDIACSINFSGIISDKVISLFRLGILNSHAGDLPKYRGNAVLAWAIINNEEKIGLCIHSMIGGELDSGKIISRAYREISLNTKIKELHDWVISETPNLFLESVKKLSENDLYYLEEQSKNPKDILRCYPRLPEDGLINWEVSNYEIVRLINASGPPYLGAYTFLNNIKVYILDAILYEDLEVFSAIPGQISIIDNNGSIVVTTGKGKIKINKVRLESDEKIILPKEIIKSLRSRFKNK